MDKKDSDSVLPKEGKAKASRKGKGAQAKATDAYRKRTNDQAATRFYSTTKAKLGIIEADSTEMIQRSLNLVPVFPSKYAIQMNVSTRGIGVSTALWYQELVKAEGIDNIINVCTIHQAFRVHLVCHKYKMLLAQDLQTEPTLTAPVNATLFLTGQVKSVIKTVDLVPSVFAVVLEASGKAVIQDEVYHAVYSPMNITRYNVARISTSVTIDTLRAYVVYLANDQTPLANRTALIDLLTVPGADVENNLIVNEDDIMPEEYTLAELQNDVRCYKRLISMTKNGFRKSFYSQIQWSGMADSGMLMSTTVQPIRIVSTFADRQVSAGITTRAPDGTVVIEPTQDEVQPGFESLRIIGADNKLWWSRRKLQQMAVGLGVASMVGEVNQYISRDEGNSIFSTTLNSVEILKVFSRPN